MKKNYKKLFIELVFDRFKERKAKNVPFVISAFDVKSDEILNVCVEKAYKCGVLIHKKRASGF